MLSEKDTTVTPPRHQLLQITPSLAEQLADTGPTTGLPGASAAAAIDALASQAEQPVPAEPQRRSRSAQQRRTRQRNVPNVGGTIRPDLRTGTPHKNETNQILTELKTCKKTS